MTTHRQAVANAYAVERRLSLEMAAAKENTHTVVAAALDAGASYRDLGALLGIDPSTVLRRHGAKHREPAASALDKPVRSTR